MTFIAFTVFCGLLTFFSGPVVAECPDHHHIDVKWNSTHYMGAYRYDSQSSPNAIQSCKGRAMKRYEGYQATAVRGTQFVEHAWVVRPGCVVYEFSDYNYQGTQTEYPAGVHPQVPKGSKSYKVRCGIVHFQCTPVDKFETVLTCDATAAVAETECNYLKTIGTTLSDSVSHSVSLGVSVEAEVSASFFSLFSATLRTSLHTGYEWTSVSEITKSSTESFEVKALAPPGFILKIEQAIGKCGGSTVRTELFRISHYGRKTDNEVKLLDSFKNKLEIVNPKLALNKQLVKVWYERD